MPAEVNSGHNYELRDLGDRRLLHVAGREYETRYSARVLEMLIERKGPERAPLYLDFRRTRAEFFLAPLFGWLRANGHSHLRVLEAGCSFGHATEWLAAHPDVAELRTYDVDPAFVEIVRVKREELQLTRLTEVRLLTQADTCSLPWPDGTFDLVLALAVVEHLPERFRRAQVDEWWRVLAPGGHLAVFDTPNRWFPYEMHSVGLPLLSWLPPRVAWRYARLGRPGRFRAVPFSEFVADGTGWRGATYRECLPSWREAGVTDLTEDAGYGWQFFRSTARTPRRRLLMPAFAAIVTALRLVGLPPSVCLPFLNLVFRLDSRTDSRRV